MSGYLIAILATFLWSIVSLIDKILVERFCKDKGVGALVVLSTLFPAVLLPISYVVASGQIQLPLFDILILVFSGVLTVGWLTLYLHALYEEDVSIVMPLMQLTPVIALVLAFLFLGEWPTTTKLIAGAIIVIGSFVLSIEQTTGSIKKKLLMYVIGASTFIAFTNTLFKFVTTEESFWTSMFWHSLGIFLTGLFIYIFHREYRRNFKEFIKDNLGVGITINTVNESLTITGDVLFAFATLLAPLALIQSMEAYQSIFVFILGIIIAKIAPELLNEDLSRKVVIQKIFGILLVFGGTIWLTIG